MAQKFCSKICLALLAFAVCFMFSEANLLQVIQHCRRNLDVSKVNTNELVKHLPASTRETKCLRACVLENYHIIDKNGKLSPYYTRAVYTMLRGSRVTLVGMERLKQRLRNCGQAATTNDTCENAEAILQCFLPKIY